MPVRDRIAGILPKTTKRIYNMENNENIEWIDLYENDSFGFGYEYFDTAIDNDIDAYFKGKGE